MNFSLYYQAQLTETFLLCLCYEDYKITQFWIKHLEFTTTLHLGAMEDGFTERIKETNHIFSQLIMAS